MAEADPVESAVRKPGTLRWWLVVGAVIGAGLAVLGDGKMSVPGGAVGGTLWGGVFYWLLVGSSANKQQRAAAREEYLAVPEEVKCPTCGSGEVERITPGSKVGRALTIGVLSIGHLSKTFRCRNCRYSW